MGKGESLTILDVGHGNAAVLYGPKDVILIDAGPGGPFVLEVFEERGITHISTVIISHADADHVRGLIALLASNNVEIDEIRINSDASKDTDLWRSLAYEVDDHERRGTLKSKTSLTDQDDIQFDSPDVRVEVVAPRTRLVLLGAGNRDATGAPIESNTMSAVIRIHVADKPTILLTGDLDRVGLDHLLDAGRDMAAPILVFPHHGGRVGTNSEAVDNSEFAAKLLSKVQPTDVLFSLGRGVHANPRPEMVAAVRALGSQVRVACTQLSEHCAAEEPSIEPTHLLSTAARGRESRRCCAGSMIVDLDGSINLSPAAQSHRDFIQDWAPTAMCRQQADI